MKKNILIVLVIVILIALFFWLKPQAVSKAQQPTENIPGEKTTDGVKTFGLEIKDKKIVFGPTTLSVQEGDEVKLTVLSDIDEEIHIHGYDKSLDLTKGQPATITFAATMTGRFEFELEHSGTALGVLEVAPRP